MVEMLGMTSCKREALARQITTEPSHAGNVLFRSVQAGIKDNSNTPGPGNGNYATIYAGRVIKDGFA
jgi:hypothetical protein